MYDQVNQQQYEDGYMSEIKEKSNVVVCVAVLSILGVLMFALQARIPFLSFEAVAQQFNTQAQQWNTRAQQPDFQALHTGSTAQQFCSEKGGGKPIYRFLSCSGGDSVNCHTSGNHAGL